MEEIMTQIGSWVGAITVLITAIIGVCQLVPGDQPEKFLQSLVDLIAKFSRK